MTIRKHLPVLVVGAGPAGLITANLLGTYGIPTVLVEAATTVNRRPRATFLDDEFFRLLDTVGLADAIRRQVLGPATYEHYSPLGFLLSREEGQITTHNHPTRSAIYQPWFDQTLLDGLARFSHVEVLLGHELTQLEDNGETVTAHLRSNGQDFSRTFSYVLAADGGRSPVRNLLGIEFEPVSLHESASLRIDVEGDPDTTLVMRSRPGFRRGASSVPAPNGRRYGFTLRPGEKPEDLLTDASLRKLFKPYFDYDKVRIINRAHYTFRSRLASRFRKGRVFLLGDAAHTQPPAGSQGMNSGARDANALVWKIAAVLQGTAAPAVLDLYETERREPMRATVGTAAKGIRGRAKRSIPAIVVGDLWTKFKTLSHLWQPAWKRLGNASHVATGRFTRVSSGVIVGQTSQRDDDLLGRVLPNPWVEPDASGRLLDQLLGAGFALVGLEPADAQPAGLAHPLWASLKARTVLLHRASLPAAWPAAALAARVADHRLDDFWAANQGRWLVVRPDRIVAAVVTSQELEGTADVLVQRLGTGPIRIAKAA